MKFRFFLLGFVTLFIVFGAFSSKAFSAPSANDILVNLVPPNPAPYENVNISLKSFYYNLDSTFISWSIDGKDLSSGVGKKSFSATAPSAGKETIVVATMSLTDGIMETKISIKPSVMVLLWQANDSYVPPFYRGKALPTPDSEVKVVAMPEIRNASGSISPNNMTYSWKRDYTNDVDGSGYGKNSFVFTNDYLEDSNNVSVKVSTIDQQSSSEGSVDIGTVQPKIVFYRNDSDTGVVWQNALNDQYKIEGESVTVVAMPYFISPTELRHPILVWNWFINDSPVDFTVLRPNIMPLQVEAGVHGTSKLRLNIENTDKIFQTTSREINVEF